MKAFDIIERCNAAIPQDGEWHGSSGEPYGNSRDNITENFDVKKILFCVTPTRKVQEYFLAHDYDLLISHHPLYVNPDIPHLVYHTALDCCEGGLNDMWVQYLKVKNPKKFDGNLGPYGNINPKKFTTLVDTIKMMGFDIKGATYSGGLTDGIVRSVAICTGLGGLVLEQALTSKADCYVVGELVCPADKTGFKSVIEIGHTQSEDIGIVKFWEIFKEEISNGDLYIHAAPMALDVFGKEFFGGSY